jgi:hypothetical protein
METEKLRRSHMTLTISPANLSPKAPRCTGDYDKSLNIAELKYYYPIHKSWHSEKLSNTVRIHKYL